MPIDTRELRPSRNAPVELITTDRQCGRCGYSLRGLPVGGRCPECGRPIAGVKSSGAKRFSDSLADAPLFYLKTTAWGAGLIAVCSLTGAIAFSFAKGRATSFVWIGIAGVAAIGWWMGVYILTSKRPLADNTLPDPVLDGKASRIVNRAMNTAWLLMAIALAIDLASPAAAWRWVIFGLETVGLLSLIPLSVHLSAMAYWASDTTLGERFRMLAWSLTASGLLILFGSLGLDQNVPLGGLILILAVWAVLIRFVLHLVFLWSLMGLANIAVWAIRNNIKANEVNARLMAKQAAHEREMAARTAEGVQQQAIEPAAVLVAPKTAYPVQVVKPTSGDTYDIAPE